MPKAMSSFLDIPISALQKETKYITEETGVISVFVDNKSELVSLSSKHGLKDQVLIPPEIEDSDSFLKKIYQEENDRNIRLIEEKLNMRSIPVPAPIRPYLTDSYKSLTDSYKREMDNVKHYFGEQEVYDISFSDLNNEDKDIILISNEVHLDDWEKRIENCENKFDKTINDIKKISILTLIFSVIVLTLFIFNISSIPYQFIILLLIPIFSIPSLLYFFGIKNLHDFEYVKNLKNKKCNPINPPEFIRMNDLILPESKKYQTNFNTGMKKCNIVYVPLYGSKPTFPTNSLRKGY